jgi:hypothetical protein
MLSPEKGDHMTLEALDSETRCLYSCAMAWQDRNLLSTNAGSEGGRPMSI